MKLCITQIGHDNNPFIDPVRRLLHLFIVRPVAAVTVDEIMVIIQGRYSEAYRMKQRLKHNIYALVRPSFVGCMAAIICSNRAQCDWPDQIQSGEQIVWAHELKHGL